MPEKFDSSDRTIRHLYFASLPAAVFGCWNLGRQLAAESVDGAAAWQLSLLSQQGIPGEDPGPVSATLTGLGFFLPLLAVSLLVCFFWARLFSRLRGQPIDPGWHMAAWLFALMLPASMPLGFAALGLSFGFVFGSLVFGGTGRYFVHPSLLGLVFLGLAYPPLLAPDAWLPGVDSVSTWAAVSHDGLAAQMDSGLDFGRAFAGRQIGSIGGVSSLLCLLGLVYLLAVRLAHWLVAVSALASLMLGATLMADIPWHWQLALGNFAFLLAFLATDRTITPRTALGRIAFGALFGILAVTLRTANPEHPEATAPALLLAMLCIPLLDHLSTAVRSGRPSTPKSHPNG